MSDDNTEFDTADAGSSHTYPMQAGDLRKGGHVMIKGNACKCVDLSSSKTGKHGHAKVHIVAIDIFTGKKMEDLCPASHNVSVPFVTNTEYQVMSVDGETGEVSLLTEEGTPKEDLNLPEQTDDDKKIAKEMIDETEKGEKTVWAKVQSAIGKEKIVGVKLT